ncbi:hypothetical protein N5W20_03645 [Candidatus Kirkpatrickella diaphorinae]|uniref:Uncharacterized protein n=1 Tax=Candidatus Kirkpatrickella diaphorinae TaxID=2984322 RepID=A0ABY6GKG5_9PROT|nr:hypothetical protein [Candidatus Kirkpatrickella diaphorinae]UYH51960.1 hypothetical protein N5W20_03645 [Candidatus Kirkpatrickella diaphorinae]
MSEPAQIFSRGWVSSGHDRDLLRFLTSGPTEDQTSNYVTTAQYLYEVEPIVENIARNYPDLTVYLYLIRPTNNFFNLEESLRIAADALPLGEARQALRQAWRATCHWTTGLWPARGEISGAQIFGAAPYHWVNGELRRQTFIYNPDFLYALPESSRYPMPVRNATVEEAVVAEDPHGVGFIPGAIVPDGCNAQPRRLGATPSTSCLPLKRVPLSTLHSRMIAKMIVTGILTGTSSGQLWSVPGHDEL